jgi:serine/threonine-protein kinase RsbW
MKSSIQIYCDRENLVQVRQFVSNCLKKTSLSDIEANALILAVDEVCANVIIHSTKCDNKKILDVLVEISNNDILFEILDRGLGYDLRKHKMPELDEIIKAKRKGGVGLMLVQKIMDKIDFIPGNKGNIIRLIKHI